MDLTCVLWAEACRCKSDVSPPQGRHSPTDQAQHHLTISLISKGQRAFN